VYDGLTGVKTAFAGSWTDICPDLRAELVRVGSASSTALPLDSGWACSSVALDPGSVGVHWQLVRIRANCPMGAIPPKTSSIPRQIPPTAVVLRGFMASFSLVSCRFAVLFIELLFVFKNLWQDKSGYYYVSAS